MKEGGEEQEVMMRQENETAMNEKMKKPYHIIYKCSGSQQ